MWEIVWLIVIIIANISFALMSVKILYNGYTELKFMASEMRNEKNNSKIN
jgi:hypothetical protein